MVKINEVLTHLQPGYDIMLDIRMYKTANTWATYVATSNTKREEDTMSKLEKCLGKLIFFAHL